MNAYERLDAWKAAHSLVLQVYRSTRSFPSEERYGLSSQLRRAAFGVVANIVEGSAKKGAREFRRYLDIAVGSVAEIRYTLRLVRDLDLISVEEYEKLEAQRDQVGRLTWGLYTSMRSAIQRT